MHLTLRFWIQRVIIIDKLVFNRLSSEEAFRYVESVDFCNPHVPVKDERKTNLRKEFFKKLFNSLETYIVNTAAPIMQSHKRRNFRAVSYCQ